MSKKDYSAELLKMEGVQIEKIEETLEEIIIQVGVELQRPAGVGLVQEGDGDVFIAVGIEIDAMGHIQVVDIVVQRQGLRSPGLVGIERREAEGGVRVVPFAARRALTLSVRTIVPSAARV